MSNHTTFTDNKGKILCVTSNFPRWKGDSTTPFVLNLSEDLIAEGWSVDVLAPHAPKALKKEKFNQVQVYRFQYIWPENQQTVCYQGGALVNLRKNPLNKLKLPILIIAEFLSMLRLLLSNKYDIIHAHWMLPQGLNAVILGKIFRIPVVVTVHGGDIFGLRGKLMSWFKMKVLKYADVVTVNSQFTGNAVKDLSTNIKVLKQIPMGVSVNPLTIQEQQEVQLIKEKYKSSNDPLLVFVGRLVEEKGVGDLLEAVALINKTIPNVRLLIAGEGQDKIKFVEQTEKLNIVKNIFFIGWVDFKKVRSYMAAGDFFIGPSRTSTDGWIEAQGLTFLEAMSVGCTVIATSSGGIKESVLHDQTGFLVDENSPEQIAEIIISLYQNPQDLSMVKENAYEHVVEHFSRSYSAKQFAESFSSLLQ